MKYIPFLEDDCPCSSIENGEIESCEECPYVEHPTYEECEQCKHVDTISKLQAQNRDLIELLERIESQYEMGYTLNNKTLIRDVKNVLEKASE